MEINFRFDESDPTDTRMTVSVNDKSCGQLSLSSEDAARMVEIVQAGCFQKGSEFHTTGELYRSENWVLWHKRSGKERRSGKDRRVGGDRRNGPDRRNP